MKRTKFTLALTVALGALLLSACGGGNSGNSDAVLTEAAQIAFTALTETAAAMPPTATASPVPPTATSTPQVPTATFTPAGTLPTATAVQQQQQQQQTGNTPCLRANLEIETIPDGTVINEGTVFHKTWRLKNTGSCTWTAAFSAVWIQGDLMDADSVVPFTEKEILPGDYAMIDVTMEAPSPGGKHYKGYWMLRSADGIVFGIGTNGKEWFWVDIQSKAVNDEDE